MSMCLEIMGIVFGVLGFLTAVITCALPMWMVTNYIGSNIFTPQSFWEGLWMACVPHSTWQMGCKTYPSMMTVPQNLQAARAMTIISIILSILGVLIAIIRATCLKREAVKVKVMIISGVFFILAGILVLIPVCWMAHTIVQDFYNPLLAYAQRELGASLYVGWTSAALLLIGGAMLCSRCPPNEEKYKTLQVAYSASCSTKAGGGNNDKDHPIMSEQH